MPDPHDVATATKAVVEEAEKDKIVNKALAKRKRRQKVAQACGWRLVKLGHEPQSKKQAGYWPGILGTLKPLNLHGGSAGYDKLAMLTSQVPSVSKVLNNASYGPAAGGFNPSVPTTSGNGWGDRSPSPSPSPSPATSPATSPSPSPTHTKLSSHAWPGLRKQGISLGAFG